MYKIKVSGYGKKYCYIKGVFNLTNKLTQKELKQLFKDNCEYIEYEQTTNKGKEASTQVDESTTEKDKSVGGV